ncbi:intraflagellar transport protein 81 homolog [Anabrus simplex]|uniref:intraflagellar transport protein 81 homolog n=1 Tax=Anabrus simplex TaxID=316456 RepID=UPI0035A2C2AE
MSDRLKYIVTEISKPPFNKNFSLISFDSQNSEQLLQVLTDILAEVDSSNKVDVRGEEPDQTTVRILTMLRVLKYKPGPETSPSAFRQGLVQGDKHIIHPILEWLFQNMADLKKRAYLAQYLVKIEVPHEILGDADIAALYEQYERLIEEFKTVHKECEALKNSGYSTAELRSDIETMEREKEIVVKRIERMQRRVENMPNKDAMLDAAHALRLEREREKELIMQKQDQQSALNQAEQRVLRLQQQLKEMRRSALGATPQGILQRLEEETNVSTYIVRQKLPKEIETRKREVEILQNVVAEPAMGRGDIDALNNKIQEVNYEVNRMVERHLATNNPSDDKLAPFRQQAAIVARKKETTAEQLGELRSKLSSLEEELEEKQGKLQQVAGETVLRGEEFKQYVNKLRGRSSVYKRKRGELSSLKTESGVLTRTIEILQKKDEELSRSLSLEEAQHGVSGFRDTEQRMELVSGEKANIDQQKGQTLEEMSTLVLQISQRIASKKAQLAPIIKELRPLREKCQEVQTEYDQKKQTYDSTAAGLESATAKLEQEVQNMTQEILSNESTIHRLKAESIITEVKLDRLAEELRYYVSNNPGDKSKSLRDRLTTSINEQEKFSRQLKEEQHLVKENQSNRTRQMKLWTDLQRLLECKKQCLEEAIQNFGTVQKVRGGETLVLQ